MQYGNELVDNPELYDAFGRPVWPQAVEPGGTTGTNGLTSINGLFLRYKGQTGCVTDTQYDLVYCHHRYYDPIWARWITRDPTGLDGGVNGYTYCNGDPLLMSDPSGTSVVPFLMLFGPDGEAGHWDDGPALAGLGVVGGYFALEALGKYAAFSAAFLEEVASEAKSLTGPALEKELHPVTENQLSGLKAQFDVYEQWAKAGWNVELNTAHWKTDYGDRVPDLVLRDHKGRVVAFVEVKSGNAIRTPNQIRKDHWLWKHEGIPTIVQKYP